MTQGNEFLSGRLLVVAFEGWNDAGEAATGALRLLQEQLDVEMMTEVDTENYYDFAFNRPVLSQDEDGTRRLIWPGASLYGPTAVVESVTSVEPAESAESEPTPTDDAGLAGDAQMRVRSDNTRNIYLLVGTEPSRNWKRFTNEVIGAAEAAGVAGVVLLGAMLADVPHTRPISINVSSENADVRTQLGIERSTYEGPVGILSVLAEGAEDRGIPTVSIWASVPHYVHNAPSPKATLALIDKLEELVDVVIPRGTLIDESTAWEAGVDALASDDEEMAGYIRQLEQARDTVDSPEASGEAIAQEFERYLRKRGAEKPGAENATEEKAAGEKAVGDNATGDPAADENPTDENPTDENPTDGPADGTDGTDGTGGVAEARPEVDSAADAKPTRKMTREERARERDARRAAFMAGAPDVTDPAWAAYVNSDAAREQDEDDADDEDEYDDGYLSDSSCADMEDAEEARKAADQSKSPEERVALEKMLRDRDERERLADIAYARFEAEQQEVELLAEMEYAAEEAAAAKQDDRDQATLDGLEPEEEQDWHDAEQDPPAK